MAHLFVVDLAYLAGPELADQHMAAHREWVAEGFAAGVFLASGRKEPRTGGVILAQGERARLESMIAADPFTIHGVAQYTITEFVPTTTVPALDEYREPLP